MTAISVYGLRKSFGKRIAVDNVSIEAATGQITGFLGPNGSGKTTTIRMICGLLRPDAGTGTVLGYDLGHESWKIKNQVGYMTQRFSLYEDLTIAENLAFVARLYNLKPVARHVEETLRSLGLEDRRKQLAGNLSGGWKQRLALAACTMHDPKLLLLDEPTAGVDPKARREFWDEIHHLAAKGVTVLVSTHYMDEAERCHKIVYISHGRIIASGTTHDIIAASGLSTFLLQGNGASLYEDEIAVMKGVEQAAPFGANLHVITSQPELVRPLLEQFAASHGLSVSLGDTTLEAVFIQLMSKPGGQGA